MNSNLSNILEQDLNWREAEMASFKIALSTTEKGSVKERAFLRAAWALLYSHYEGFCKFAWDSYLDELERFNIKRNELREEIALLSLMDEFKRLRGNTSDISLWSFFNAKFTALLNESAKFEQKLETDSNLWPNLFKDNASALGLPTDCIDEHASHIKTLVSRRNEIAHGKKMTIKDVHEYIAYENSALIVMHDLAVCLIDAIEKDEYRKVS